MVAHRNNGFVLGEYSSELALPFKKKQKVGL